MVMERTNRRVDNWTSVLCCNLCVCTSVSCDRRRCDSGPHSRWPRPVGRRRPTQPDHIPRPARTRAISTALSKVRIALGLLYPGVGNVIGPGLRLRSVTIVGARFAGESEKLLVTFK